MKIKRFFAPDIRQAMRMVRDEQGPDAVILSNKRVDGGVEIVAAIDYDERMMTEYSLTATQPAQAPAQPVVLPEQRRPVSTQHAAVAGAAGATNTNAYRGEPALMEMKSELRTLRAMLEGQLSSLAWGSFARGEPRRVELIQRLMRFGMTAAQCRSIADTVANDDADIETLWSRARAVIARGLPLYGRDPIQEGGIIALVGPTGAGKTTTVAKLAAHYALHHGKRHVALVTIDNYRVGAHEQLRSYGRILDVPVRTADSRDDLRSVLDDLADRSLVLIDTSGMSQHDSGLARQAELLDKVDLRKQVMLLLPATSRLSGLDDVIESFSPFAPDACIPTKVDETTCLGGVLSAAVTHQLPLAYISDGQRVPEDLHAASAEDLVTRAAHIMNRMGPRIDEDLLTLSFGKEIANANF